MSGTLATRQASHFRGPGRRGVGLSALALGVLLVSAGTVMANVRDRYAAARSTDSAGEARVQMERILGADDDSDVSAEAALWLGQYEYALGRLESAYGYFERAAELTGHDALGARIGFWLSQAEFLLAGTPPAVSTEAVDASPTEPEAERQESRRSPAAGRGPVDSLDPASTYELLAELAHGDEQVRSGELLSAARVYLGAEGRARESGRLGPLAYRVALAAEGARSAGEKNPLLDGNTIEGWSGELATAPERGFVVASLRVDETIAPPRTESPSDFASPGSGSSAPDAVDSRKWGDGAEGILTTDRQATVRGADPPTRPERDGQAPTELLVIQLGAFGDRDRAREEMERLTSRGLSVRLERGADSAGDRIYRIRLGAASTRGEAEALASRVLDGLPYQLVPVEP